MSWYSDPWTQDDSVLVGLPYTVAPPEPYSINGVKTVWHWSSRILDGLPYTVWMTIPQPRYRFITLPEGEKSLGTFPKISAEKKNFSVGTGDRISIHFEIKGGR